ncbi:MAG: ABC transporter ATP-binding protein, partial [bacterium]|nr:ABC transporter ATP-binding protein [bacterium]
VISEISHRIYIMYAGEIVETGSRDDIFNSPHHPYTKALFEAIPGYRGNFKELKPIPGTLPDNLRIPAGCMFYPRCPARKEKCLKGRIELARKSDNHFSRCIL